ncbi:hypothetical protein LEP1GSC193_3847 [Leptospira alstonii serovar Pingchang str. 80-412]|uniref:Uncharacterized protein n=2 Tax=Leptospira alstonii TaxID=28452 RepID=M6CYW3_9LEPT|nr:hypothetical protein LEP1GSC194_2366 [Leptospira alstonii serovar Sichuan str. 79601]EQA80607.1 hypothetical protein LEP1GSC193_3847 [Leptospira alstonii serovar Pingchang str. 80-412]
MKPEKDRPEIQTEVIRAVLRQILRSVFTSPNSFAKDARQEFLDIFFVFPKEDDSSLRAEKPCLYPF